MDNNLSEWNLDTNGEYIWDEDLAQSFDPTLASEQGSYFRDCSGNFLQMQTVAHQGGNMPESFGNRESNISYSLWSYREADYVKAYYLLPESQQPNPGFRPDEFQIYQSLESLSPSTTSASSGFFIGQRNHRNINEEAQRFRDENPLLTTPAPPVFTPDLDNIIDSNGDLDEDAFKRRYPNFGKILSDFVTMAIILLYFDQIIQSWPSSDILLSLAKRAIEIILAANAKDTSNVVENSKFLISLL